MVNFTSRQSLRKTLCSMSIIIIIITLLPIHLQRMQLRGAFHSTKISRNSGSKSNGTESFWKFVSKISAHLSRLFFFLEIWKFQQIPVPFGISTQNESVGVPLFSKSFKMAAGLSSQHCTGCKIICHSLSLFLIAYSSRKRPGKLWTGCSEFPVGHFARFAYSPVPWSQRLCFILYWQIL